MTLRSPSTSLGPGTRYHFRIVARNATGTVEGDDQTLTTLGPAAERRARHRDHRHRRHPRRRRVPAGTTSTCVFEYGTSSAYGQQVPCEPGDPAFINEQSGGHGRATAGQFSLSFAGEEPPTSPSTPAPRLSRQSFGHFPDRDAQCRRHRRSRRRDGSSPYLITFLGALAGQDVEPLKCLRGTHRLSRIGDPFGGANARTPLSTRGLTGDRGLERVSTG